jgi:hypothetical protein
MTDVEPIEDRLRRTFRAVAELPVAPVVLDANAKTQGRRGILGLRRLAAAAVIGALAAAVVLAVIYGPRSSRFGHSEVPATQPTPLSTTTPSATTTTTAFAQATAALDAVVAAEEAKEATAAVGSPENIWGPVISEHSPPVPDGDSYVAVTAYSFDPDGHPVQVLSYTNGKWVQVAALSAPTEQGTIYHADAMDLFSENTQISVAEMSGNGRPQFLVKFAGGGCFSGAVVSQAGTENSWRFVPFVGPFPTSDVTGGDPRFEDNMIVSDNDCTATPTPAAQRYTWTWTYDVASGDLRGVQHFGWTANPLGVSAGQ